MNILKRLLDFFERHRDKKRHEEIEKLKDKYFEIYYTNSAKNHLNCILESYDRPTQNTYQSSLDYIKAIGLYEPCSDNVNYLKHMRWASLKYRT